MDANTEKTRNENDSTVIYGPAHKIYGDELLSDDDYFVLTGGPSDEDMYNFVRQERLSLDLQLVDLSKIANSLMNGTKEKIEFDDNCFRHFLSKQFSVFSKADDRALEPMLKNILAHATIGIPASLNGSLIFISPRGSLKVSNHPVTIKLSASETQLMEKWIRALAHLRYYFLPDGIGTIVQTGDQSRVCLLPGSKTEEYFGEDRQLRLSLGTVGQRIFDEELNKIK